MKNKAKVVKAIVLAGGYSRRTKLKIPKQLAKIDNKPLLAYTLDVFERCSAIDSIILVINRKFSHQYYNLVKKYRYKKIEQICLGGKTRQQSVFNALRKIRNCDYVVIHDGVRPLVTQKIILAMIKAVKRYDSATCAVSAQDTIAEARTGFIGKIPQRERFWHIQTPQAFRIDLILKAHRQARLRKIFNSSDDAQLVLNLKKRVKIVKGSHQNLKITNSEELHLAKLLLQNRR